MYKRALKARDSLIAESLLCFPEGPVYLDLIWCSFLNVMTNRIEIISVHHHQGDGSLMVNDLIS